MNRLVLVFSMVAAISAWSWDARAGDPRGVGLGVAAGVNIAEADSIDLETSFSWGFFVDIPLLETFYITPSATVYQLRQANNQPIDSITDIDLNFKFLVPLGRVQVGAGITAGITTGFGTYQPHVGALGYFGLKLAGNFDIFALLQYKRLTTGDNIPDYNAFHIFAGPMFRF